MRGVASWYCNADRSRGRLSRCTSGHPDGPGADLYAAIRRSDLELVGRRVTVCARRCVVVRIIDCNCGDGANLVDLYGDAFEVLAPLSAGHLDVALIVSPPATDAVDPRGTEWSSR